MTPHNRAKFGEIAKIVLMAGDPLRVRWIAENFLDNVRLVNDVRNAYCYTGKYKGKEISVMAHGMGIPSIGIYSYELYKFYDVQTIIRIGSTGSYLSDININDVLLVNESYSDSTYASMLGIDDKDHVLYPDENLNELITLTANDLGIKIKNVRSHASDVFYTVKPLNEIINTTKASCVEMEAFGLFANAKLLNKKAACLLTCSDSLITGESLDFELRQSSFKNMVTLALESSIKLV